MCKLKMLLSPLTFVVVVLAISPRASGQNASVPAGIATAELRYKLADMNSDDKLLNELLHPGYVSIRSNGEIKTRAEVLSSVGSKSVRYSNISYQIVSVLFAKDAVILAGTGSAAGTVNGKTFNRAFAFTRTYLKMHSRWLVASNQITPIATTPPAK